MPDDAGAGYAAEQDDLVRGAEVEQTRLNQRPSCPPAACSGVPHDDRDGDLFAGHEALAVLECERVWRRRIVGCKVVMLDGGRRQLSGGLVEGCRAQRSGHNVRV